MVGTQPRATGASGKIRHFSVSRADRSLALRTPCLSDSARGKSPKSPDCLGLEAAGRAHRLFSRAAGVSRYTRHILVCHADGSVFAANAVFFQQGIEMRS